MTSVRRIYVDSRLRSGGTNADFTYDLPRSIEVPDQTIAYVDSVLLPNVFTTIHENNNRLYFSEWTDINNVQGRIYTLPEGNLTGTQLAQLVQDTINSDHTLSQPFSVAFEEKTGKLTISNSSGNFAIPTRDQLNHLSDIGATWGNQTLQRGDLRDCHDVIGFNTTANNSVSGVLVTEGFVDLLPYKNLFLCSSTIGNLGTVLGPVGQGDIIRRIAVTAPFGNLIYDAHSTTADYIDCSLTQLSQMQFRLTDESGRPVQLKGHGISFSICFVEKAIV